MFLSLKLRSISPRVSNDEPFAVDRFIFVSLIFRFGNLSNTRELIHEISAPVSTNALNFLFPIPMSTVLGLPIRFIPKILQSESAADPTSDSISFLSLVYSSSLCALTFHRANIPGLGYEVVPVHEHLVCCNFYLCGFCPHKYNISETLGDLP